MCSLFRNKYRNETIRLNGHDYSSGGKYFVTICTHCMISYFGNISCDKMFLSESGQIANKLWYEIPKHFPFVSLDEFVVMPNHIHGIIIIEPTGGLGTVHATSLHRNEFMSTISPKTGSLPTVIRSYKSAVSKNVHFIDHDFLWQPRYYDHLIRTDREMNRIRKYIIDNPYKWDGSGRCMQRPDNF